MFNNKISALLVGILLIAGISIISVSAKSNYSVVDSTNVQKAIVGLIELSEDTKSYDIDNDGKLTVIDATNIQKRVMN